MSDGVRTGRGATAGLAALVAPVLAVPVLVGALVVLAHAPLASPGNTGDDARAVELLRRSATAAERVSYSGTQYVSTWSAMVKSAASTSAVVQVRHGAGGQTEIRLHDEQTAILDGHVAASWLAGDGPAELLLGAYDVRTAGEGQVAGRDTDIIEARRPDGSVAARLWLDRRTGLSLRREAFAEDGYPLSASAFVDVTVDEACCQLSTFGRDAATSATETNLRWADIERLRSEGWHCPEELDHGMVLYEARWVGDAVQFSYSDGVMTVSVFEQPGRLDADQLSDYTPTAMGDGVVYTLPGPPARITWSTGEHVITVVAEAPMATVEELIHNLPPEQPAAEAKPDGVIDRIGRGAQRVGSWINPFD